MPLSLVRVSALLALLVLPTSAFAQAKAGDKEISIFGLISQDLGGENKSTTGNAQFGVGFFLTDRFEITVQPSLTISSGSTTDFQIVRGQVVTTSSRHTDMTLGVSAKALQFFGAADAKIKPYVGGEFYIFNLESAGDSSFAGANFGLKNYISEKAAIDFNGTYGFSLKHPGDSSNLRILIGLSYIF